MTFSTNKVGKIGEQLALQYLLKKDFTIKAQNFYTRYGEIDIIAQEDNKLHFVEVKTRVGIVKGKPYEAVTARKLNHLKHAIHYYILKNKVKDYRLSLDVVSIVLDSELHLVELQFFESLDWR